MDSVVHFEIPVDNLERGKKFYKSTFGWKTNDFPELKYVIMQTTEIGKNMMPKEVGMINGGMMKRNEMVKYPVLTIDVDDIDSALNKIEKNGGKILAKKMSVGDMGYSAYFKDSEGNVVGLWEYTKKNSK